MCFFGKYAFANPNDSHCYVDWNTDPYQVYPEPSEETGTKDIMDVWRKWFVFNFCIMMVTCVLIIVHLFEYLFGVTEHNPLDILDECRNGSYLKRFALIIQILITVLTIPVGLLASTIWGCIIRFNGSGKACSEELLDSSGMFILVWQIIEYAIFACALCMFCGYYCDSCDTGFTPNM